jgi:predicted ATPase/DNA-binding CsgD family transcriptional regulator
VEGKPALPPNAVREVIGPFSPRGEGPLMADLHTSRPNNLPIQLTSFVGRTREIAEVKCLLAGTRLLTLTGAGGCGKSRLALRVVTDLLEEYADGIWLVELASLTDPTLVSQTVAAALTVRERLGRPITDTLAEYLRSKSLLLVLDNCEHVRAACTVLADVLLRACPNLRVLATSREILSLAGEAFYRVPPLSVPDPGRIPPLEQLSQYEAVRLFVERARASQPGFRVTKNNAPAMVQVCHRLDGMPLAIELAAVRVKVLAVEQIAARLDDRFRLLTGGSQETLPRHQTLRAAMDWSYALLSDKERCVLRRLSVFAGGWTLEAAEAVSAGDDVETSEVLDVLAKLVDKSLVGAETEDGEARFRLPETVRQYALDRLFEFGEAPMVRRRHRDWYLSWAERAGLKLRGPEQVEWLDRLGREHDNLRAALEWSTRDEGGAEAGLRLAGALWWFWFLHGYWSEGQGWLEGALSRAYDAPPRAVPKAMRGACYFAWRRGDYERATALGERALVLSRELGDRESSALCLLHLGLIAHRQGDNARAKRLLNESLAFSKEIGDRWLIGQPLAHLGRLAEDEGDLAQAEAWSKQSLALFIEVGDKYFIANALRNLGLVALRAGDYGRTSKLLTESLTLCNEIGNRYVADACLWGLAGVACAQERYERAARLFGGAEALRETLGEQPLQCDKADRDQRMAATRARLGNVAFAAALAEGRGMALEQAIEYALAPIDTDTAKAAERGIPARKHMGLLTPREREVAALIARGLTNREIASSLVIAERTADAHVQHILNKLGFNTRAQIAAWVVEHGLRVASGPE